MCVLSPHSLRAHYIRNDYRWGAVIRKPESAWLEGTPAIHVTCLYVSVYMRVVDTHSILKCNFYVFRDYKRATAWLFQVGESESLCVAS